MFLRIEITNKRALAILLIVLILPISGFVYTHAQNPPDPQVSATNCASNSGKYLQGLSQGFITCAPLETVPYVWLVNNTCGFVVSACSGGREVAYPLLPNLPMYNETDCGLLFSEMSAYINTNFHHGAGAFVRGGYYNCTTKATMRTGNSTLFIEGVSNNATVLKFVPTGFLPIAISGTSMTNLQIQVNSHVGIAIDSPKTISGILIKYTSENATAQVGFRLSAATSDVRTATVAATSGHVEGMNITSNLQRVYAFTCQNCKTGIEFVHASGAGSQVLQSLFTNTTTDLLLDSGATKNQIIGVLDSTAAGNLVTVTDNSGQINYMATGDTSQVSPTPGVVVGPLRNTFGTRVEVVVELGVTHITVSKDGVAVTGSIALTDVSIILNEGDTITLSATTNVAWFWWRV